ncbi:MAG: NADH-quinone oxidoreductase subunit J [Bacillota bacterium]|nr:NADH-quinone oxidoreductase subunit J [Bacillota bacterium]
MSAQIVAFGLLGGLVLYSAWRVATAPLITHAALFLALTLVGVAGFFFMLQAEFLAVVQILVYVGAVMTVIIFAIMLSTPALIRSGERPTLIQQILSPRYGAIPLLVGVAVTLLLLLAYGTVSWDQVPLTFHPSSQFPGGSTAQGTTGLIGEALLTRYIVPFEVVSLLLLAAMVGAIVLAVEGSRGKEDEARD